MQNIIIHPKKRTATSDDVALLEIKNGVLAAELEAAEAEIVRLRNRISIYRHRQFDAYRKALIGITGSHEDYRFIVRDIVHMLIGAGITLIVFICVL